jgi:PHD/YefM family antitoxin component YafN of YafNO toxin-antitoxin module
MMTIKPSAAIRKNYNEVSELCKRTGEPVYLTKNGEGDLVVMDMETYARRARMAIPSIRCRTPLSGKYRF